MVPELEPVPFRSPPAAPTPAPTSNRRASYRRPPRLGTGVEVRRGVVGIGFDVAVSLVDVSAGGACVRLSVPVQPGDLVHLALLRPGASRPHRLQAEVRWGWEEVGGLVLAGVRFRYRLAPDELDALAEKRSE